MGGSSEAGTNASSSLLGRKKGNYRDHYVNGLPFTICMSTFAVLCAGSIAVGASMLVAGGVKEAQDLAPPVDQSLHSKVYGAKHAGVGFANYVVGNEVSKFWTSEMGGKGGPQKMSDPFSFLRKGKKKSKASDDDDSSSDDDSSDDSSAESPERQADDAQPVDSQHHRIAGAPATDLAIRHAQDVADSHADEDEAAQKGREHLLRLLRTGRSASAGNSPAPKLHPGMFHEHRGRQAVHVPSDEDMQGIESATANARAARGGEPQKLHEDGAAKHLVVSSGKGGIPELHVTKGEAVSTPVLRTAGAVRHDDNAEAMRTLRDAQKDMLQKTPGHVEPVVQGGVSAAKGQPAQGPNESFFHYKWRISH